MDNSAPSRTGEPCTGSLDSSNFLFHSFSMYRISRCNISRLYSPIEGNLSLHLGFETRRRHVVSPITVEQRQYFVKSLLKREQKCAMIKPLSGEAAGAPRRFRVILVHDSYKSIKMALVGRSIFPARVSCWSPNAVVSKVSDSATDDFLLHTMSCIYTGKSYDSSQFGQLNSKCLEILLSLPKVN